MKQRIYLQKNQALREDEWLEMARLLIKAGYTVRIGKEKPEGKSQTVKFIEYWV